VTPERRAAAVVTLAVAATVAVLAGALAAVATMRASHRNAVDSSGKEAVAAASSKVPTMLSYDYRHLDEDFQRAEALLTPEFRKRYITTTAKAVKPLAAKYKAITSAAVTSAGLVSAEEDEATVLVFVAQTSTNSRAANPRLDRSRVNVTMVRGDGGWLIDDLQPV
jgi:Mce-associated membrane protein